MGFDRAYGLEPKSQFALPTVKETRAYGLGPKSQYALPTKKLVLN